MTSLELNDDCRRIIEKVQKMLALADKAGEHEAAVAATKAQEMLAKYNISMSMVEAEKGGSSKREKSENLGGLYLWQRKLWMNVAELNFCMYFQSAIEVKRQVARRYHDGTPYTRVKTQRKNSHRIIGRVVNVAATVALARYLEGTIERLTREKIGDPKEYFTRYANSYREGLADTVCMKIQARRDETNELERKSRLETEIRAKEAAAAGHSTSMAMTMVELAKSEEDANIDFIYGPGTSAKWAAQRAKRAEKRRLEEEAYTAWAAANPEEARKKEAEAAKQRRSYGRAPREKKYDYGAYSRGRQDGGNIGIDTQVGNPTAGKLTHGR